MHLFDIYQYSYISTHISVLTVYSQLISYAWFNLTGNNAPRAYPPGDLQFLVFLGGLFPTPWARRKRPYPTPELQIDLIYVFLGTSFWFVKKQNETFSQLSRTFSKVYWEKDNGCHNVVKTWTINLKTKTKKKILLKSASLTEQFIRTLDRISVYPYISKALSALYPFSYISFLIFKARLKKYLCISFPKHNYIKCIRIRIILTFVSNFKTYL